MKRVWFLSGILALVFGGVANAATIDQIQANGTGCIQISDKKFCDFSLTDPGATGVNESNVGVTGELDVPSGAVFLHFQGGFSAANGAIHDWGLQYSVTALGGLIDYIDQSFNSSVVGTGGIINIAESVYTDSAHLNKIANSSVGCLGFDCDNADPNPEVGDNLYITPPLAGPLYVQKDIFLQGYASGGVFATIINQSFHQVVPEPVHYSLLLGGCLMVGLYFKSRKRAQA